MSSTAPQQVTRTDVLPGGGEIDIQVSTAKRWPRDLAGFKGRAIALATIDEETAGSCMYALPRRNKQGEQIFITGPSVRLAEIVASTWGNLRIKAEIGERKGNKIAARCLCWDLETNVAVEGDSVRTIYGKKDDAEQQAGQAAQSIALRNAVFRVIPRAYIEAIYKAAQEKATGGKGAKGIKERIETALQRFSDIGIEPQRLLWYFRLESVDDLKREHLADLIGLWNAHADGTDINATIPTEEPYDEDAEFEKAEQAGLDGMTEVG